VTSIPLSILVSICVAQLAAPHAQHHDPRRAWPWRSGSCDPVAIENNHRHMGLGSRCARPSSTPPRKSPRPRSSPRFDLHRLRPDQCSSAVVGGYLFRAAGDMAVVFAMMASYFSRGRSCADDDPVPAPSEERQAKDPRPARRSIFRRAGDGFEAGFERLVGAYEGGPRLGAGHRAVVVTALLLFAIGARCFFTRSWGAISSVRGTPGSCASTCGAAGNPARAVRGVLPGVEDYIRESSPPAIWASSATTSGCRTTSTSPRQRQRDRRALRRRDLVALNNEPRPTADYRRRSAPSSR